MANSSIINKAKNKVVKELIKNDNIIQALDSSTLKGKSPDKYIRTHIFDYAQNPLTITDVQTFILVLLHIPEVHFRQRTEVFVNPRLEFWIFSHERHMKVDNIPKVTENRNDYIAELIDNMFNGRTDFGIGKLKLILNEEGTHQQDYLYRHLVFEGIDINNSLCDD